MGKEEIIGPTALRQLDHALHCVSREPPVRQNMLRGSAFKSRSSVIQVTVGGAIQILVQVPHLSGTLQLFQFCSLDDTRDVPIFGRTSWLWFYLLHGPTGSENPLQAYASWVERARGDPCSFGGDRTAHSIESKDINGPRQQFGQEREGLVGTIQFSGVTTMSKLFRSVPDGTRFTTKLFHIWTIIRPLVRTYVKRWTPNFLSIILLQSSELVPSCSSYLVLTFGSSG